MSESTVLVISYDRQYDILYARYPNGGHSYGEENPDGVVVFRNIESDAVTGVALYDASKKIEEDPEILKELPVPVFSVVTDGSISKALTSHEI